MVPVRGFPLRIVMTPPAIVLNKRMGLGLHNRHEQEQCQQRKNGQAPPFRAIFSLHLFPLSTP